MVEKGEVIYCPQYLLTEGVIHDTWFVVLDTPTLWDKMICLKSTSKGFRYGYVERGCNSDKHYKCFYIPSTWQSCFTQNSYLVLPDIYEISLTKFLDLSRKRQLISKGVLEKVCLDELLDCLSCFYDDIAEEHWERLFGPVRD